MYSVLKWEEMGEFISGGEPLPLDYGHHVYVWVPK